MEITRRSFWRHKGNGTFYKVLCVSNTEATRDDYPITVTYHSYISKKVLWSSTEESFLERMTPIDLKEIKNEST